MMPLKIVGSEARASACSATNPPIEWAITSVGLPVDRFASSSCSTSSALSSKVKHVFRQINMKDFKFQAKLPCHYDDEEVRDAGWKRQRRSPTHELSSRLLRQSYPQLWKWICPSLSICFNLSLSRLPKSTKPAIAARLLPGTTVSVAGFCHFGRRCDDEGRYESFVSTRRNTMWDCGMKCSDGLKGENRS